MYSVQRNEKIETRSADRRRCSTRSFETNYKLIDNNCRNKLSQVNIPTQWVRVIFKYAYESCKGGHGDTVLFSLSTLIIKASSYR